MSQTPTVPDREPVRSDLLTLVRETLTWSGLIGGLAIGGVVSLLHVLLNEARNPLLALGSWMWLGVLNWIFVAAVACVGVLLLSLGRRVLAALPAAVGGLLTRTLPRRDLPVQLDRVWFGLQAFAVFYLVVGVLYGLTYDQAVLVKPQGWIGMSIYLVVCAGLLALIGWWGSKVLLQWVLTVGLRRSAVWLLVVLGLAHAGVVAKNRSSHQGERPLRSASGVVVAPAAPVEQEAPTFPAPHVVLLGFDGLDPLVLDRLIEEGHLPNFKRWMEEGTSAPLGTLPDANSAVIWSSIYTGHRPEQHGIHDFFRVQMPGLVNGMFPVHRSWTSEMVDVLSRFGLAWQTPVVRDDLRRFPVWEIVDHFGVSAGVIDGYLNSYPAVNLDSEDSFMIAYGADLFAPELDAGRMQIQDIGLFMQPIDLLLREQYPRDVDFVWQSKLALELLATRPQPRFLNLYWHEPDALQHNTWRELEPWRFPFAGTVDKVEIIEQHKRFDAFLGRIESAVAPGTVFLLVSDHGHSATMVHAMDTQHRHGPDGVMILRGYGVESGATLDAPHVFDVVPTVLALLGLPLAEDMPGRVLSEAFRSGAMGTLGERTVPSYEDFWRRPAVGKARDPRLIEAELNRLRAMGYL